jgi:hypothetical protein
MGGNSLSSGKRGGNYCDDSILNHISVPVSAKDLPLCLSLAPHAEPLRLHFWNSLVGNSPQLDRIFCSLPCKFTFLPLQHYFTFL